MPTHKHSKIKNRSTTAPFSAPVAAIPAALNPAAHHGLTVTDYCLCGATRMTNISVDEKEIERGPWTGGDPNYQKNKAAVALGSMSKGATSERKRLALSENARKPRGIRAARVETLKEEMEFPFNGAGKCVMAADQSLVRRKFRIVTTGGGRISWSVRWYHDEELVKVVNSTEKPAIGSIEEDLREAEEVYREWMDQQKGTADGR